MVSLEQTGDQVIIRVLEARLHLMNVRTFHQLLQERAGNPGARRVVLDLEAVEHLDSSAVGSIVAFNKELQKGGAELVLAHATPTVLGIFEVLKMERLFHFAPTVEAALAAP